MNFEQLNKYLKCVEAILQYENGNCITVFGDLKSSEISKETLIKYFPKRKEHGEFIEYSSISVSANSNPHGIYKQIDILLTMMEPIYIFRQNSDNLSCLIIKFYNSNIKQSLVYSYENLQLVESIISLWYATQNYTDKKSVDSISSVADYIKVSKNQLKKIDFLNNELNILNLQMDILTNKICNYFLSDINPNKLSISISDTTANYIKTTNESLDTIKLRLQEAFKIACELNKGSNEIRIKNYYFIDKSDEKEKSRKIENENIQIKNISVSKKDTKIKQLNLSKTEQLLDKYEMIAEDLRRKNLPILGKNIAANCLPPISAPALTDSINKHTDRIILCLKNYPEKWQLLRSDYKPVKNLIRE